jgi:hypothetical protein
MVLISISALALASLGSWQLPAGWTVLAFSQSGVPIDPLIPRDTLSTAGLLFGSAAGALLANQYVGYSVSGSCLQKILRYCAGIILLFVIWLALSPLTHPPTYQAYLMTYVRSAIAGLWICIGAPLLFRKTGLAGR